MSDIKNILKQFSRRKFMKYGALTVGSSITASSCNNRPSTDTENNSSASKNNSYSNLDQVTASWLPIMPTTPFYVALEENLFEQEGIEIKSAKFEDPNKIINSLISGRADFGPPGAAAGIAVLAESRSPNSLKVFGLQGGKGEGKNAQFINDTLLVPNNSNKGSFKDLKGSRIGTVPGIQWRTITRYIVRRNNLDPDQDVEVVDLAPGVQLTSVASGSVDATLSLEPVGSIAKATGDGKRAMINPCETFISNPFCSGAAVLTTRFIEERPDVARRVVRVIDKATQLANQNFDNYRFLLAKYTAIDKDQAEFVAQPYLRSFKDLNDTDIRSYQRFINVFREENVLKKGMSAESMLLDSSSLQV